MIYPLAFGCIAIFAGAFLTLTSEYLFSTILLLIALLTMIVAFVVCLFRKNTGYALTLVFCVVLLVFSCIYTNNFADKRTDFTENFYGKDITVTGTVAKASNNYYISVHNINNKATDLKFKIMIPSYNIEAKEGDNITAVGKLYPFDKAAYYGGYNSERYYFSDNVYGYLYCNDYEITGNKQTAPMKVRAYIKNNIDKNFSGDYAAMLKAILVGDKSDMTKSLKEELTKSGLSHIAVVSGMHISIIISVVGMCFSFVKRKRFLFLLLMFLVFGTIVAVIGGHPSVIRAVIMAAYCVIAATLKKRYDPFTALMFSAGVMTIYNPFCVASASFLLSFLATFALIIGSKKKGKNLLYVTVSVFIITLPVCLFYFNRATFAMFFTNLIISPIMTVMLPLGYLMQGLPFLCYFQDILMRLCMLVIKTFASVGIFNISAAVPSVYILLALYIMAAAFYSLTLFKRKKLSYVLTILSVILILVDVACPVIPENSVTVFNNDENALHIKTKNDKDILITSDVGAVQYYIEDNNLNDIDALILTRFTDNIGLSCIKKVYVPYTPNEKLKGDFGIKYYDDIAFGIDDVVITPVSHLQYKKKVDDKKPVLLIETADISILFEPYKDEKLNEEFLKDIYADVVVLKYNGFKNIKTAVGSGLQTDENVIYYDLTDSGSVTFYKNKTRTLR